MQDFENTGRDISPERFTLELFDSLYLALNRKHCAFQGIFVPNVSSYREDLLDVYYYPSSDGTNTLTVLHSERASLETFAMHIIRGRFMDFEPPQIPDDE